jgi:DNA-binding NarL/FixJ family response regulator
MSTPITLYLADDHQIIIDGLKQLISSDESIRIIGSANDVETARREITHKKPDLALIDVRMPHEREGLDMILSLRKVVPGTKFIVLSMHSEQYLMRDAINGGASGYLAKNTGKEELSKCLAAVLKGGQYFPALVPAKETRNGSLFTPREIDILKLIQKGHSSQAIADKLFLSLRTIETHRKNIGRKAGTSKPIELINFLRDNKIEL